MQRPETGDQRPARTLERPDTRDNQYNLTTSVVVVIVVVAGFVVAVSVVFADVVAIHKTTYLQGSGELH